MRLCRYEQDWRGHWGILEGDTVCSLEGDPFAVPARGAAAGSFEALTRRAERPLRVYDNHCPSGPVLVTKDELDWRDRAVRLWVDGQLRQEDTTSSMLFSPAFLVSDLSKMVTVRQGDLIMTGTPGGVEGTWLTFGQTVELEIGGIRRLRNHVTRVDGAAITFEISVKKWLEQGGEDLERAAVERAKALKGPSSNRPAWKS